MTKIEASEACSQASIDAAREGAIQGSTLLKNVDAALPLDAATISKVAVIGPNSDLSKAVAGYYGGNTCDGKYWTMIDAVQQYVDNTVTVKGVPSVTSDDVSGIPDAVAMAKDADAVVLAIGTDLSVGREGHDANTISLSEAQQQLVDQVAGNATGPVIVVTFTHNPFDISSLLKNDKIGAVIHVGQPSVQIIGVGDVLFGERSPAGRTVATIYPASYADQISIFDFNMRPGPSAWPRPDCPKPYDACQNGTNPGRTHRFYIDDAVVPFGYGLSYTTWKYEVDVPKTVQLQDLSKQLQESADSYVPMKQPVEPFKVKVTNTGSVDADDVVLAFASAPGAGQNGIPLQDLVGFERVHVKAGKTAVVTIQPELSMFSQVDMDGKRYPLPGEYTVRFGLEKTSVLGMGFAETTVKAMVESQIVL